MSKLYRLYRNPSLIKSTLSPITAGKMNICSVFDKKGLYKTGADTFPVHVFRDVPSENQAGPGPASELYRLRDEEHP